MAETRHAHSANTSLSLTQVLGVVLALLQAILLWWVFDQTTRLRTQEMRLGNLEASLAAVQPFANQDRTVLTTMATVVSKQDVTLEQTVALVRDINSIVQTLAKQQIELRAAMDRMEQKIQQQPIVRSR